jgi:transposase-like protein
MAKYRDEYKLELIQRMMPPHNESVIELSNETGIPEQTLYKWKRLSKAKGIPLPSKNQNSEKWSPQDKFSVVLETATLSEIELAKYCRSKGLYVEQVKAWKDACMQANGGVAKQATELQAELKNKTKDIKKLEKELRRKDAALAETAALLVLRKKANAIWGDNEED